MPTEPQRNRHRSNAAPGGVPVDAALDLRALAAAQGTGEAGSAAAFWLPTEVLAPWADNPRHNTPEHVDQVRQSIERFGFAAPVIGNARTGELVAGHTRILAARVLGMHTVPVRLLDLSDEDAALLALADNRLTEMGVWDEKKLADVLVRLREEHGDGLRVAGFDDAVVAAHIRRAVELEDPGPVADDGGQTREVVGDALRKIFGTAPGQVWSIVSGERRHKMIVGDSGDVDVVRRLMGGVKAELLFTSPPYNVGIEYGEHLDAEVDWPSYRDSLTRVLRAWKSHIIEGGAIGWNVGVSPKTHHDRQSVMLRDEGFAFIRQIVWMKAGVAIPLWGHSQKKSKARAFTPSYAHEVVYVMSNGPKLVVGGFAELDDALATDILRLKQGADVDQVRVRSENPGRPGARADVKTHGLHPAPFPMRLPEVFIRCLVASGGVVCDPYLGSGTTILAADRCGRVGYGAEKDPVYAALVLHRAKGMGMAVELDEA